MFSKAILLATLLLCLFVAVEAQYFPFFGNNQQSYSQPSYNYNANAFYNPLSSLFYGNNGGSSSSLFGKR
jgi:hypothetical protein